MNSLETVQLNLVLKEGWQRWKLSHAFNLIGSGTTPPTGSVEYFQKEIPWVNTGDLNDGYIYSVNKFVSEKAVSDFSALKVFPTDSLIIALYGATIGKLGILKIDACTNQACCILSEPNHLDTKFVFYWLMSERNNIIELAQGGGQPNISQEIVKNLRVFAPDIETQKLIATFLDRKTAAIDTLIAKKQRLIQLLEEKRTALINQAVTKGLNPNVPMKDSSIPWIGKIPEHWEIYHLNRVVKKFVDYRGKTPEKLNLEFLL
jgi:type I restriction enzyme S subunit